MADSPQRSRSSASSLQVTSKSTRTSSTRTSSTLTRRCVSPRLLAAHRSPTMQAYTGSTRSFAALLKSCLKLDRHALALCRLRTNTQPEFAVLIPQAETFTKDGGQDDPPGFHVIPLPFRDDIRQPPRNMTDNLVGEWPQRRGAFGCSDRMFR